MLPAPGKRSFRRVGSPVSLQGVDSTWFMVGIQNTFAEALKGPSCGWRRWPWSSLRGGGGPPGRGGSRARWARSTELGSLVLPLTPSSALTHTCHVHSYTLMHPHILCTHHPHKHPESPSYTHMLPRTTRTLTLTPELRARTHAHTHPLGSHLHRLAGSGGGWWLGGEVTQLCQVPTARVS